MEGSPEILALRNQIRAKSHGSHDLHYRDLYSAACVHDRRASPSLLTWMPKMRVDVSAINDKKSRLFL
jgi:hypothetical protein